MERMTLGQEWLWVMNKMNDPGSWTLASKWKEWLWVINDSRSWIEWMTLGRDLRALNEKITKTNSKVDRKQMGSKSYTWNAEGQTTKLGKEICPTIQGTHIAETTSESIILWNQWARNRCIMTNVWKIWTERTLYVLRVVLSTNLKR